MPKPKPNQLSVTDEIASLQQRYQDDPKQNTFNLLLTGDVGSGKTHLLKTARKPVHVDSFDPGGTKTIRQEISQGSIVADTRWEDENAADPHVFKLWTQEFNRRVKSDYFSHFATYSIDSLTMWQQALMNYILASAGIPGKVPRWGKDYMPHKVKARNFIDRILSLPCDVIIPAHLKGDKDEVTGRITYKLQTTGDNKTKIPLMFDEIWVMQNDKDKDANVQTSVLTRSTGRYTARSRLASNGKIPDRCPPDLKQILNAADLPTSDMPLPGQEA